MSFEGALYIHVSLTMYYRAALIFGSSRALIRLFYLPF